MKQHNFEPWKADQRKAKTASIIALALACGGVWMLVTHNQAQLGGGMLIFAMVFLVLGSRFAKRAKAREYGKKMEEKFTPMAVATLRKAGFNVQTNEVFNMELNLRGGKMNEMNILGFTASQTERIEAMTRQPFGLIVVASTAGQHKTEALKVMTEDIAKHGNCKITVLNNSLPVEFFIQGATVIPITNSNHNDYEKDFLDKLNAAMHEQPDVIVITETRDVMTAQHVMYTVYSGPGVLTALHADNAMGILDRLVRMGVDPRRFAQKGFVSGLVYQRLMPVLCPNCRIHSSEAMLDKAIVETGIFARLATGGIDVGGIYFHNVNGCSHCANTGYEKHIVCAEVILPDDDMLDALKQNDSERLYRAWRSLRSGDIDANDDGYSVQEIAVHRMEQGLFSPMDIESLFGYFGEQE